MGGKIVYRPVSSDHWCKPPTNLIWCKPPTNLIGTPAEPIGTIWLCDCGRAWTVTHGGWEKLRP